MWSDWLGRLCGTLSFIFTVLAGYYQFITETPKRWLWILAGLLWILAYLIAAFSLWQQSRPDEGEAIASQKARAELQKLKLEISDLRWRNSLLGRLNHLAIAATIVATVFGLWHQYNVYRDDRDKEYRLNVKELTAQLDTRYNADLDKLLRYPVAEKQSLPEAVLVFKDIRSVIEDGYKGIGLEKEPEKLEARRYEVGFLLDQIVRSAQFDLKKAPNIEFDLRAMEYCDYYAMFLRKNPSNNMEILTNYKNTLLVQHYNQSTNFRNMSYEVPKNKFYAAAPEKDKARYDQFLLYFFAYKKHVEILNSSRNEKDLSADESKDIPDKLNTALCWYYGTTLNRDLTKSIFQIDDPELETRLGQCE